MIYFLFFLSVILLICINALGSYYFGKLLSDGLVISIIPKILNLKYVENTGAAFGILSSKPLLITIFNILILIILTIYVLINIKDFYKSRYLFSIILIISGGFGNIIDRMINGYVTDYFEFSFIYFPVFNFADIFITVGAFLLIVKLLMDFIKENKKDESK